MPCRIIDNINELAELIGQEIGVSDWLTVPQSLIDAFAQVTGDRQWIHVDSERARNESPYGTTVAHGFLTLAVISQLHAQAVRVENIRRIINYGLNRVRFPAPVPAGSRIRTHSTLQALAKFPEAVQLTWLITMEVEGQGKPALVAEWLLRYYP